MGPRGFARGWQDEMSGRIRRQDLQWGRGGLPADGCSSVCLLIGRRSSFNGAAGVCPRMVTDGLRVFCPPFPFNGAAGVCPRMDRGSRIDQASCQPPSMGPRGFARGWAIRGRSAKAVVCLQWGRGGLPADGSNRPHLPVSLRPPSMGPRGFARGWGLTSFSLVLYRKAFNGAAGVCPRMVRARKLLLQRVLRWRLRVRA